MSEPYELQLDASDGGGKVKTGLVLPDEEQLRLTTTVREFPTRMLLEWDQIERALQGDFYRAERQRLGPWMINQSSIGKCNASADVGAVDQLRDNSGQPHIPLADNDLYLQMNGGQDRGSALIEGFRLLQTRGCSSRRLQVRGMEKIYPHLAYRPQQVDRDVLEQASVEAPRFKGWEFFRAPERYDDFRHALASAAARRWPVVFAWAVGRNGSRLRNGYVQVDSNGKGNHANVFSSAKWVGGNDKVHMDCRNSWGPVRDPIYGPRGAGWGENGFGLFTMEDAFQCNRWHYTFICTSATADPNDPFTAACQRL